MKPPGKPLDNQTSFRDASPPRLGEAKRLGFVLNLNHQCRRYGQGIVGIEFVEDVVELYHPQATDKWLEEHVAVLSNLEDLSLYDSHVSDAGLEHLKGLHKLQWVVT